MASNLRKRTPISYYEPEEPSYDHYVFCDQCVDYVYEYCAIHGPLLVIPDDKIRSKPNFPSFVPRAALTIPHVFLHLAHSIIPGAGIGVFSTLTLPRGVRFGPYRGKRTQTLDSMYCWQIYDHNNKRSHYLDAADGECSNWMRYVNCARHWREQNLLAYQYKGQLYYRTIKIIPRFTELMVFYGSEFANALDVNLSKYNSDKYYIESTPFVMRHTNKKENKSLERLNKSIDHQETMNTDQFEFIDEIEEKENNENDTYIGNIIIQDINVCSESANITSPLKTPSSVTDIKPIKNIENNRFECDVCQKTFLKKKYLKKHSLMHSNVWKYQCEHCHYRSNFRYRFNRHIAVDFHCQNCFYRTNCRNNFQRHRLLHEDDKDAAIRIRKKEIRREKDCFLTLKQCEICDFNTMSRRIYSRHRSQHRGNIYKCDLCNYSNHSKYNLSRHILRKH